MSSNLQKNMYSPFKVQQFHTNSLKMHKKSIQRYKLQQKPEYSNEILLKSQQKYKSINQKSQILKNQQLQRQQNQFQVKNSRIKINSKINLLQFSYNLNRLNSLNQNNNNEDEKIFIQNSIFKRRVNSQQKPSNPAKNYHLQQKQKIDFTKKIIYNMRQQQTQKRSKIYCLNGNIHLISSASSVNSANNIININNQMNKYKKKSKSVELRTNEQKIQNKLKQKSENNQKNKEKMIRSSLQKLKPAFRTNQINFHSRKISSDSNKINYAKSPSMLHQSFLSSRQSSINPKIKVQKQNLSTSSLILTEKHLLNSIIVQSKNLQSYASYINANQGQEYSINIDFLSQFKELTRQELLYHLDIGCLKLIESIFNCIAEILASMGNGFKKYSSNLINVKKHKQQQKNWQILKQYLIVYTQCYTKYKNEYILTQILLKPLLPRLFHFFVYQRMICFYVLDLALHTNFEEECQQTQLNVQISSQFLLLLANLFKISGQSIREIVQIVLEEKLGCRNDKNQKKQKNQKKSEKFLMLDPFRIIKLTKEFDRKNIYFQEFCSKLNKNQTQKKEKTQFYFFKSMKQKLCILISLPSTPKSDQDELNLLFKLEMTYAWAQLMVPPLFFLPSSIITSTRPFTLVIDLDKTLVYYNEETRMLKYRPYMDRFLTLMCNYFELIVFSSYPKQRSDIIIKEIQRDEKVFAYRLYKNHMVFQYNDIKNQQNSHNLYKNNSSMVKNINFIGRKLQKVLFIDDEQQNTNILQENSLLIKTFNGDKADKELLILADLITSIMQDNPKDLRNKFKPKSKCLEDIIEISQQTSTIHKSIKVDNT